MAISNLISDDLYFAIHETLSEAINYAYDSDNIDSVTVDDDKRIVEVQLSANAMNDNGIYNKALLDDVRYEFKEWNINPFRKMEFNKEEGKINLYLKCDKTLQIIEDE